MAATDLFCGHLNLPAPVAVYEAPPFQRVKNITSGYRVGYSWTQCATSLFAIHNESVNVWTHLVGLGYFLHLLRKSTLRDYSDGMWGWVDYMAMNVFLLSAAACAGASSCFHLLGCRSARTNVALLRWDMTCICCLIYGSYIPGLLFSFCCHPIACNVYLITITFLVCMGIYGANTRRFQARQFFWPRVFFFVCIVMFAVLPMLHYFMIFPSLQELLDGSGEVVVDFTVDAPASSLRGAPLPNAQKVLIESQRSGFPFLVGHLLLMLLFYLVGFIFYFTGFPECHFPKRFDIWLSSHQVWHLCIVFAVHVWYVGLNYIYTDYAMPLRSQNCQARPPLNVSSSLGV